MSEETTPSVTLGPKSKSILLQVAFKAAVELINGGNAPEGSKVGDVTDQLFALLVAKHQDHGAGDEPQRRSGGGGYRKSGGGYGGGGGSTVELDGVRYYDNISKKGQRYFKSVDKIDAGDHKLVFQDNPEFDLLVQAAKGGASGATASGAPDEAPF